MVPAFVLLYHRDVQRIGERSLLPGLLRGEPVALSRMEPEFAAPSGVATAPIGDIQISRTPLQLKGDGYGGVHVQADISRVRYAIHGRPGTGAEHLSREDLDHGVLLTLGDSVLLLLTRVTVHRHGAPEQGMIGHSDAVERLRRDVLQLARVDVPVLIRGETGSGKERVARAIHAASARADKPFVAVNMAAISSSAAASEFFGHKRGAFTDAVINHPGYFGSADGGTLFLDEIGESTPAVQALLLRALDEGQIQPVGGLPRQVDVRLIAATDADLEHEVHTGRFRDALLHRIQVCTIDVPPLRRRRDDIAVLLVHFLREQLRLLGAKTLLDAPREGEEHWLPLSAVQELTAYDWPGNVRQLRNIATEIAVRDHSSERAAVPMSLQRTPVGRRRGPSGEHGPRPPSGGQWSAESVVPARVSGGHVPSRRRDDPRGGPAENTRPIARSELPARVPPGQLSDAQILGTLRDHRWNITASAKALNIAKNSLVSRMADMDGVRRAGELTASDIDDARVEVGDNPRDMAMLLRVSERGLLLRLRELQNARCGGRNTDNCNAVCTGLEEVDGDCRGGLPAWTNR